jgi:hypothetical protein
MTDIVSRATKEKHECGGEDETEICTAMRSLKTVHKNQVAITNYFSK